jgi:elongation factor P
MYGINDLKTGTTFEEGGQPWLVLTYEHSKMGRGGAVLRTKLKNLLTGATVQKTFQGSDKFEPVNLERKKAQYLYEDSGIYFFMDEVSFEQFPLDAAIGGDAAKYIKEGDSIQLQYYKGKPINVDLPIKVKLKVTHAEKADKGNTATAATKPVELETGFTVNAPMFIKEGDTIVIDTRDGSYVERATK